ncbi:hypothetical protein NC653_003406 [Populus alba x Populus x berolinensis]|uniref:Uncharacterized protein n=1 Tax=Populus alba x Populus x berolinensis TaxID=444605 RepID=A0AAD6RSI1_9ROSI|nr:hypothetical protein NC653_003406 [Populus alba x Populus x berolinensis]
MNQFLVIQYTLFPLRSFLKVQNIGSIINRSGICIWYGYFFLTIGSIFIHVFSKKWIFSSGL